MISAELLDLLCRKGCEQHADEIGRRWQTLDQLAKASNGELLQVQRLDPPVLQARELRSAAQDARESADGRGLQLLLGVLCSQLALASWAVCFMLWLSQRNFWCSMFGQQCWPLIHQRSCTHRMMLAHHSC